ncbi:unannotated protein [freshwater metagenome]|uniref:Unannotated protein n=1 Tax=freshwater metagenome TaxID=449393 RepID=A0A6J6LKC6_9ZZZZ|nr:DUF3048 domain-containing protein [Actinomycetota bacterium]
MLRTQFGKAGLGLCAIAVPLLIASCSSGTSGTIASQPPVSSTPLTSAAPAPSPTTLPPTPTPTPSPSPSPIVLLSPLTGLPEPTPKPVLVVKLDNTRNAQPHAGLGSADVVYIEEVEWGLTRIAAIFSSAIPNHIGPVRSARITDIELLAQYGSPAFAFSGAQQKLWPMLEAASFEDVSANKGGEGYSRDSNRRAPYNYFADGQVMLERAPKASFSTDIGFLFSEDTPLGGRPASKVTAEWPYSSVRFVYDPITGRYNVRLNGAPAKGEEIEGSQQASTVVIQYVKQTDSGFHDHSGGRTPLAETVGTGKALVLRDGQVWDVIWNRPSEELGTTFALADGSPMPFKPGQQWVALVDRDRTVRIIP